MAKPTQYATPICLVLTLIALVGIILGLIIKSPLLICVFVLPTVGYEIYRTEGTSTKLSSIILFIILILEIIFIKFKVNYDLATFLERDRQYIGGYIIPLGDIKIVGPIIIAVMSIILFIRTYGPYTKWLSVIIFLSTIAIIYALDPGIFKNISKFVIGEGLYYIPY